MNRRYIQTMGNWCFHENPGDNVARENNFATSKNVIHV
jgi:hypothetical protein